MLMLMHLDLRRVSSICADEPATLRRRDRKESAGRIATRVVEPFTVGAALEQSTPECMEANSPGIVACLSSTFFVHGPGQPVDRLPG